MECAVIADFSSAESNNEWFVVNDNVMGGRSLGDRSFADGTMTFAGAINTNGGGFASIRRALPPDLLSSADRLVLRARSDRRSYMVTLDDSLPGRNQRISFRAPLAFAAVGEWETVTVQLTDFFAAYFGEPIVAEPLRSDLATQVGIMQSDGIDGEFMLEIDRIEACG